MKVQMHSIRFDADQKLIDFIQKKIDKLEVIYDRIVDGEVIMKLERNVAGKNDSYGNKLVEIKLNIPGQQLFAKEHSDSFEAAADLAIDALRRQLKKFKQKRYSH
ncbi:MAG: ribosome hibernation-promoting factor, HPF/YfiA family [Cyclobacteriaceae bacterium]